MDGFLLVDKPIGVSSGRVDGTAKKLFSTRKVGHLGTLDPFASGLLLLGVGNGTGLFPFLSDKKKTYEAKLKLGIETDTLDNTGKAIKDMPVPILAKARIEEVLSSFVGTESQIPPLYSAKHVGGERAYDLARAGVALTLKPVEVTVFSISFLSYDEKEKILSFSTEVSAGTYIRSLGRDIAARLSTCGSLIALRRTKIGPLSLQDATPLSDLTLSSLVPVSSLFPSFPVMEVPEKEQRSARNGNALTLDSSSPYVFAAVDGKIAGVYQRDREKENLYRCKKGFSHEDYSASHKQEE
ncbi:MAG: tRNA pseudouridine(55) synthase TruB [Bacilli bacterium]|jgi:tRNA pseudouridine55 synthase